MRSRFLTFALVFGSIAGACAGDTSSIVSRTTSPPGRTSVTTVLDVRPDEAFPVARCESNRAAGTITFLTSPGVAAAASVIDVIVASESGYYDELCLDVEVRPSSTTHNYDAVASGDAQFASGGSFSELVAHSTMADADLVAATVEGRTAIDTLIVRAGSATELDDLDGTTLGVTGAFPPAVDVMLRNAGLTVGDDVGTVQVDGSDPVVHLATDGIVGVPGRKSDELGVLERAGVGVAEFDPLDFGVPGSFGVIFTSNEFVTTHPTAAKDFVRATMRGLGDAVADPAGAAALAVSTLLDRATTDGEMFRWETEAALILDGTPEGLGLGIPDPEVLQAELDAYRDVGFFADTAPQAQTFISATLVSGVYGDDEDLVWPA